MRTEARGEIGGLKRRMEGMKVGAVREYRVVLCNFPFHSSLQTGPIEVFE
jgi:hypothetical protein